MQSFTEIFSNTKDSYIYTAKIACDDVTPEMEDKIEQALGRLDIISLDKFKGTPLQENPLDFPNLQNTSVQIADFSVSYPSSTDMLERMVSEATGLSRSCVVVYTENDPRKVYTEQYLERNDPATKEGYVARTGTEYQESEHGDTPSYGQEKVDDCMERLIDTRKDRKVVVVTNTLIPAEKVEAPDNAGVDQGPEGTASPFTPETREK